LPICGTLSCGDKGSLAFLRDRSIFPIPHFDIVCMVSTAIWLGGVLFWGEVAMGSPLVIKQFTVRIVPGATFPTGGQSNPWLWHIGLLLASSTKFPLDPSAITASSAKPSGSHSFFDGPCNLPGYLLPKNFAFQVGIDCKLAHVSPTPALPFVNPARCLFLTTRLDLVAPFEKTGIPVRG
jgi:hypothetical protein